MEHYSLFSSENDGYCVFEVLLNKEGQPEDLLYVQANAAYERMTGFGKVAGRRLTEVCPDTKLSLIIVYAGVALKGIPARVENYIPAANGWFLSYVMPMQGLQIASILSNITENKFKAERQQYLLKLSDTLRTIADPILIQQTACRLLGEYLGVDGELNVKDPDIEIRQHFEKVVTPMNQNIPRQWTSLEISLMDETAERTRAAVERARIQEALRKSESLLASVFKVLPVGLGCIDTRGNYLLANEEMRRFMPTGVMPSVDNSRADRWIAYNPDGSLVPRSEYPGIKALQGDPVIPDMEMIYVQDDGQKIWTRVASLPMRDEHDTIIGAVSVVTDINQLKALLQQRDEFIGIAGHELKTPLTSMKAYAEIVQEQLEEMGNAEESALVGRINRQIDKLTTLINHLLDTTRISEGKLQLNIDAFNINELLAERIEEIRYTTNHEFIFTPAAISLVKADRERISQVITNLLSNAVKYSPKKSVITISSESKNDECLVTVKDHGSGIPLAAQHNLFERFYRITDAHPGMGLGLYISAQIIQRHGGKIAVQSDVAAGTEFSFTLSFEK